MNQKMSRHKRRHVETTTASDGGSDDIGELSKDVIDLLKKQSKKDREKKRNKKARSKEEDEKSNKEKERHELTER